MYTLVFPGHYVSPAAGRTPTASGYAVPTFNDDAPCPAPPTPCPAEGGRSTSSGYEVSIHASSTLTPCPRHSTTESGYQIPLCQSDVAGVVSFPEARGETEIYDDLDDVANDDGSLYAEVSETAI